MSTSAPQAIFDHEKPTFIQRP